MELVYQRVPAGVPGGSTRVNHHGGLTSSQTGVLHVPGTPNSVAVLPPPPPFVTVPLQSTWMVFAVPSSVILTPSLPPVISQHCAAEVKLLLVNGDPLSVTAETTCGL